MISFDKIVIPPSVKASIMRVMAARKAEARRKRARKVQWPSRQNDPTRHWVGRGLGWKLRRYDTPEKVRDRQRRWRADPESWARRLAWQRAWRRLRVVENRAENGPRSEP